MRVSLIAFLMLCSLSVFAADSDLLITKAVAQADSLIRIDKADKALLVLRTLSLRSDIKNASCAQRALLHHKIGVCHYNLDQYKQALKIWKDTALQIRLSCLGVLHKETANSYYAVAMAYRYLEDRTNEAKFVQKALEILELLPQKDIIALAYNYLQAGSLFDDLEDYGQAIYYYDQAERLYKSLKNPANEDLMDFAEVKKLQGLTKSKMGKSAEGVRDLLVAIDLYNKTDKETRDRNLAHCYNNLSIAYLNSPDFPNAERYARMALELNKKLNNTREISNCYETLGVIRKKQKKYTQALSDFKESLNLREVLKDRKLIANAWENMADVFAEQKNYEQAIKYYENAVIMLVADKNKTANGPPQIQGRTIIDRPSLLRVLALEAASWFKKYDQQKEVYLLEKAYSFYQAYDTLHIQIRQQYKEIGSKYRLMQSAMPVYEQAIHTALQLQNLKHDERYLQEAYLFNAKIKAAILLEGLQDLDAKLKGIPAKFLEQEKSARDHYVQLERQFFEMLQFGGDQPLDSVRNEMFAARRDYDKLIGFFEQKYPRYFQLKYAFPNATTIQTLKRKLPKDAVVVEYFIGVEKIYTFKISNTGIECFQSPKPADFDETCLNFIQQTNGASDFNIGEYTVQANKLYEVLMKKPLERLPSNVQRIIVIPDQLLLQLSFDVLPYKNIRQGEKNMPYLIKKYAISIAYSNQLLFNNAGRSKRQRISDYGGFGLEYDDYTLQGFKMLKIDGDTLLKKRSAGRLPHSDDEIAEIAQMLQGDAWINDMATKKAFWDNASRYDILHLAMHGIVDEKTPLNSALIFSREKSNAEDFILRAAEIYGMDLNAQLAVLSACNTGNGDIAPDGVRSLARAFTHAGCPSMVASLWYAYDGPTREILVSFFKYLKAGKPKDIAMQMAKNDYLKTASPTFIFPEYWSNLTVIGDVAPLQLSPFQGKDVLRLSIFLLGIALLFWVRRYYLD